MVRIKDPEKLRLRLEKKQPFPSGPLLHALQKHKYKTNFLAYEDLTAHEYDIEDLPKSIKAWAALLKQMGLDAKPDVLEAELRAQAGSRKQAPMQEVIYNYEEVRDAFHGSNFAINAGFVDLSVTDEAEAESLVEEEEAGSTPEELPLSALGSVPAGSVSEEELWDGADEPEADEAAFVETGKPRGFQHVDGHQVPIQVMGLQVTGTHLLESLLEQNFGARIEYTFWKHAKLSLLPESYMEFGEVPWKKGKPGAVPDLSKKRGIAIIRDPFSWLASVEKSPGRVYKHCVQRDNWLTEPCTEIGCHSLSRGSSPARHCSQAGSLKQDLTFASLPEIWNQWNAEYDKLSSIGFGKFYVIRFEDLVLNTEATLDDIAKALGLERKPTFWQADDSVKRRNHHVEKNTTGHGEAVAKIRSKTYLAKYTKRDLAAVCAGIDAKLARAHGYLLEECPDDG